MAICRFFCHAGRIGVIAQAGCTDARVWAAGMDRQADLSGYKTLYREDGMRQALFWEKAESGALHGIKPGTEAQAGIPAVVCRLCFRHCRLQDGERGFCGVRENRQGVLMTLVDDNIVSLSLDPVEKKPLFHFLPGTGTLSLGTWGCNFACTFCQNAHISRRVSDTGRFVPGERVRADDIVSLAKERRIASISCTYNEPTVFYELMTDIADRACELGIRMIMVSNGCMEREPLLALKGRIHAANIDLKAFSAATYRSICSGSLSRVLDNLVLMKELGLWLEVTTLVIPGVNDTDEELAAIAGFIRGHLGAQTPWHVSAFFPCYQMKDRPPTPPATIHRACLIGRTEGLSFVYGGNVRSSEDESTLCPQCHGLCIARQGYRLPGFSRDFDGHCPTCGALLPGVWR